MKSSQTKQRLLQTGLDLISVHGLDGVTLGQLATVSGMSKSGLFAHFRSKEQLQMDLLASLSEMALRVIIEPAMQAPSGVRRIRSVMEHWRGWWRRAGLTGGCPIASALFELDDIDGDLRNHAARMERQWREQLGMIVAEAKSLGQISADTDVDQFVWEMCANYLGHHVSSRFLRSVEADTHARLAMDALIDRHLPRLTQADTSLTANSGEASA